MDNRPIPDCLAITQLPNEQFQRYWQELIGVEAHKRRLHTHMQICLDSSKFLSWRESFNKCTHAPTQRGRVLIVGPPGTGKTILAKGVADFYTRSNGGKGYLAELGAVRGKFVGESSKNIERAFDYVQLLAEAAPVILFMDEFDSVGVSRNTVQMHDDVRAMVNTLIRRMNLIDSRRIFVIAASNLEKHVDYATKRRFDFILYFQRPTQEQRIELLEHLMQRWKLSAGDILKIAKKTNRYTQDDITRTVNLAEEQAFAQNKPLSLKHLLEAVTEIKPTEEYS